MSKKDYEIEKILVIDNKADLKKQTKVYRYNERYIERYIIKEGMFLDRSEELEKNEKYRQVIPYVVIQNVKNNEVFVAQRTNKGGEKRLVNKSLIGFGGHVREKDFINRNLLQWAEREIKEELKIRSKVFNFKYIGLIIDNETPVSRVHLGIIIVCMIDGDDIEIKEKDKLIDGRWKELDELKRDVGNLEKWSKMTLDVL